MSNKNLWFKAKEYGWGWYPITWQGWLTVVLFIVLVVGNAYRLNIANHSTTVPVEFLIETGVLVIILIAVCFWKGEKPGWKWGK
jgi:drug/metabolite transporter (DMT)-like permease